MKQLLSILVLVLLGSGCGSANSRESGSQMSVASINTGTNCQIKLTNPQLARKLHTVKDALGCPITGAESDQIEEGLYVVLEKGALFWLTNAPEAYALSGKILEKLWEIGGPGRQLGYPISDIMTTPYSQGQVVRFQKGAISMLPGKEPQMTIWLPGLTWR